MTNQNPHVAEVVTFHLNEGVADDDCMSMLDTIGGWASALPGFISRHVSHGDDGSWVDVTVWDTAHNAQSSQASFMEQPFAKDMIGMIEKDTFSMVQRPIVWQQN